MNGEELVKSVDAELTTLLDECVRNNENPRLIRVIKALMRLTDVEGDRIAAEESEDHQEAAPAQPAAEPPAQLQTSKCPPHSPDVFGTCGKCGQTGIKIAS